MKYIRDISEAELTFFFDEPELNAIAKELNLALLELERILIRSVNLLLQVFTEITVKVNSGTSPKHVIIDAKRKRSDILANWYEDRYTSLSFIRTFSEKLKITLLKRLKGLTS